MMTGGASHFLAVLNVSSKNPDGIPAQSPRLACRAYLGYEAKKGSNTNGVVAKVRRVTGNE
jgi:hypothetical protein